MHTIPTPRAYYLSYSACVTYRNYGVSIHKWDVRDKVILKLDRDDRNNLEII